MKKWTKQLLVEDGNELFNAEITNVSLNFRDYGSLTLDISLCGEGNGLVYGGHVLGKGYLDSKTFTGSASGLEAIMRIMDVVGVEDLMDMKGEYVRVAYKGLGSSVKIIGNIIKDKWFDYGSFFDDKEKTGEMNAERSFEALEKLKKPSTHSNPEDVDPLFCRYNKGWNDAIKKVEKLFNSYSLSDMWIPVDVKLPPKPKPNHNFKGDIYLITVKKGTIPFRAMWNGEYFTDGFEKLEVIAWMPLPEPYKENKHE